MERRAAPQHLQCHRIRKYLFQSHNDLLFLSPPIIELSRHSEVVWVRNYVQQ